MAQAVTRQRGSGSGLEFFSGAPVKLNWGSILGGALVALGVWVLLYALGLALGLSSVDPNDPGSAKAAGIGTGIWSLIAPLIALFVGGAVASRTAGVLDKTGGALHGAVVWSLTTLLGVVLMGMALSNLLGAAVGVTKTAASAAGSAVQGAANNAGGIGQAAKSFGLDANDALQPVNQRLRAEGKPAITANQLEAATKDVVQDSVRQGRLDRDTLVSSIAENTRLSRRDSEDVANRVEQQWNQAQGKVEGAKQQVQQGALNAADKTGKAFWGIFGALFLGLISAVLGATTGVTRRQRVAAEGAVVARDAGLGTPHGTRREVYP